MGSITGLCTAGRNACNNSLAARGAVCDLGEVWGDIANAIPHIDAVSSVAVAELAEGTLECIAKRCHMEDIGHSEHQWCFARHNSTQHSDCWCRRPCRPVQH